MSSIPKVVVVFVVAGAIVPSAIIRRDAGQRALLDGLYTMTRSWLGTRQKGDPS